MCARVLQVSELCYLMANTYSKKQLLRMERRVLCTLKFDLSHTPPIHFLLLSAYIARCGEKVHTNTDFKYIKINSSLYNQHNDLHTV